MHKKIKLIILSLVLIQGVVFSGPRQDSDAHNIPPLSNAFTLAQLPLEANNIRAFIWNSGIFNQDLSINNHSGFYWPIGTSKTAIFTTGLSICGNYNGSLRASMGSYKGEYRPGYVDNGIFKTDTRFRLYSVKAGDLPAANPDVTAWADMIPFGAPWVDKDSNGVYDPNIDAPGIKDAAQTMFVVVTDADQSTHTSSEGFGGGSAPLFNQIGLTAWCYISPGLGDLQFIRWVVINRSNVSWQQTYMSVVVDPDLGDAGDDYIGCDTTADAFGKPRNMGYCYNADNQDGTGSGQTYGTPPPASGMDYFLSPIYPTGNNNDTVFIYNPPGSKNKITKVGYRELGMTSFNYFNNSAGPLCERDPSTIPEAYNFMKGFKKDGSSFLHVPSQQPTKFCFPGDPETSQGWTEYTGGYDGCGGVVGTLVSPRPPGDRRFIFNSGPFTVNAQDTQYVVLAQFVTKGSNNKNSVTQLKQMDVVAQKIFDLNFQVLPPPPPPVVQVSSSPATQSLGTVNINLSWGDISETYDYDDVVYGRGYFKFQGYEVYEIRKDLDAIQNLDDITQSRDGISLVAVYDYNDTIGVIMDSIKNGQVVNNEPQYSWVPVVPYFGFNSPSGFPNTGLSRHITLTNTAFSTVNGGSENFIYGNSYKFAVIAYGYNSNGLASGKVVRNTIQSQLIRYTPEAPVLGTEYYYKNGDTLNTNRRDLSLMPIVVNQENVIDAKYRLVFNTPDTTYNVLRSLDNGASFQTLKSNLKFTNNLIADDSSRIFDGILFKYLKIRYTVETPPGTFTGNYGVISDTTIKPNSYQTRQKGWEYIPSSNRNVEGSKYLIAPSRPWQSQQMSVSYPNRLTYSGIKSLLNPQDLKTVQILFTGYGNGQQAYRYQVVTSSNYQYQDMREVPFKVYEIDSYDASSTPRQLNVAFLENPDGGLVDNKFEPNADTTGGKDVLYVFKSDYNSSPDPFYTSKNLFLHQGQVDVMYCWSPKLISATSPFYLPNDQLIFYPYTVAQPEVEIGFPLIYEVNTKKPVIGSTSIASQNKGLSNVKVVPNPYYGFNALESSSSGRFITFRNLPKEVTIRIFTLNGDMIRKLSKNDNNSTLTWNMENQDAIPIASGIYIALVDAPGIGTRSIKVAIFTPEERVDF